MKTKAVLFDLGGTLVKNQPIPNIMKKILGTFGIERSIKEIEEARSATEKHANIEELPILGDEFWYKWNAETLQNLGIRDNVSSLAEKMTKLWWNHSKVELYPDAEKTLKALKQNDLKVGLITNGLQSDVKEILPRTGLENFFDIEVTSDLVKKMKPNREIFLYALEKLGVSPHEAIFVGDILEIDYEGAQECGLRAFLIDREKSVKGESIQKIESLTELLRHL